MLEDPETTKKSIIEEFENIKLDGAIQKINDSGTYQKLLVL